MGRRKTSNLNNNEGNDRGVYKSGGGNRGKDYNGDEDGRDRNSNEQGRNKNYRRGGNVRGAWRRRGGNFRGRGGHFRDYNDRGQQYGPQMDPNFYDNRDNQNHESANNLEQNLQNRVNDDRNFPKFKDDTKNVFMSRHQNRTNFENPEIPPLLGFFEYQQNNNNMSKTFECKTNQPEISNETHQVEIQKETSHREVQREPYQQDKAKEMDSSSNIVGNIKKESTSSAKKPIQKTVDSSSSDSSSESDDSSMEKLKKAIQSGSKSSKKQDEKKILLPKPKIKQEPGIENTEKDSSSSDSSTSSSSESENSSSNEKKMKKKSKKQNFEEEVICLGKLEKFENLIDDDETNSSQLNTNERKCCILCDQMDHTSFYCQMICKNCGAQYHNLKNCPKPANLSMMLQNFLEFCLNQCTIYNPEQRFSFRNGNVQTELLPAVIPSATRNFNDASSFSVSNEYGGSTKPRKKRFKSQSENLNSSKLLAGSKNKNYSDSEQDDLTDSSSSIGTSSTKRKRKRQKLQPTTQSNTTPSYPGGMNYSSPFAFNPMMAAAFSQMMGFNPAAAMNFSTNVNKEKL